MWCVCVCVIYSLRTLMVQYTTIVGAASTLVVETRGRKGVFECGTKEVTQEVKRAAMSKTERVILDK